MFECVLGQGLENTKAKGKQDEKIENIVAEYKGRKQPNQNQNKKQTARTKPKIGNLMHKLSIKYTLKQKYIYNLNTASQVTQTYTHKNGICIRKHTHKHTQVKQRNEY